MELRALVERDHAAAEAFLVRHCDSSMFLRANMRRAGFEFSGRIYEANYVAAFEGERVVAVIAHCWNGMVLVQAPVHAELLAAAALEASGRAVTGFSGPRDQVQRVRAALSLEAAPVQLDEHEDLYALELAALQLPAKNSDGVVCRRAEAGDREPLVRFRVAYEIEALGAEDDEYVHSAAASFLDAQLNAGHAWVALIGEQIVSLSAFNATLPDIVQLGGIYTPPELRGRSYARYAVYAQLLAAREAGADRAVLFTKNPSAVRCYAALGFRCLSEFALVLLR